MKATHTPGPWNISKHAAPDYCPQFGIYADGAAAHSDLAIVKDENAQANARLIAAAPELLEALRYYVELHERWRMDMPERNENDGKAWERTRKIALDAIAKATPDHRTTLKVSADPKYAVAPFAKPGEEN